MRAPRLVLASASPRRRELLAGLGLAFDVVAADVDESPLGVEDPRRYVGRVATAKATAVVDRVPPGACVLAADTTVDLDGRILAKPLDAGDAAQMLHALAGRDHLVHTGVAVAHAGRLHAVTVTTEVAFAPLGPAEIDWYVGTGEPLDKAGAYALQGIGGAFVTAVRGSVSNVIGLPLAEALALLADAGIAPWARD
jgi:septum formation protein